MILLVLSYMKELLKLKCRKIVWLYHFAGAGKMVTFRGNKDMNELILNNSIFENIKHIDDNANIGKQES